MLISIIITFLLSKAQDYILLLSLYWQETIKAWQNFLAEDLKDQCIEMNIKQNVRIKIQQMSINIFSNQTWQEQIV